MNNFCKNCGTAIETGARFCGKCGTPVESLTPTLSSSDKKIVMANDVTSSKIGVVNTGYNFLCIPVSRLIWASILSFGLYIIFWFYTNWEAIRKVTNQKMSSFWRGVFSIFWTKEPFSLALKQAQALGYKRTYNVTFLQIFYFIASLVYYIVNRTPNLDPLFILVWLIVGQLLVLYPLIKVQGIINWSADKQNRSYRKLGMQEFGLIIVAWVIVVLFSLSAMGQGS